MSLLSAKQTILIYTIEVMLVSPFLYGYFQFISLLIQCSLFQVSMVSRLKNDNFVELHGYCVEGNLRVLAYEFATMGSLHDILHGM